MPFLSRFINRLLSFRKFSVTVGCLSCLKRPPRPYFLCGACVLAPYFGSPQRAINTLWCILEKTDLMWIPVIRSWRLNERHYGALQVRSSPHCRKLVWFVVTAAVASVQALKAVLSSSLWWWLLLLLLLLLLLPLSARWKPS